MAKASTPGFTIDWRPWKIKYVMTKQQQTNNFMAIVQVNLCKPAH